MILIYSSQSYVIRVNFVKRKETLAQIVLHNMASRCSSDEGGLFIKFMGSKFIYCITLLGTFDTVLYWL